VFLRGISPDLLQPPVNALRLALHPDGLAGRIANLGEWRAHLLGRVRRDLALSADPRLAELYTELRGYPCDQVEAEPDWHGASGVVVPLRIRYDDRELAFFSMVASFGTPRDITVDELAIESFFPADQETATTLRHLAGQ
jgi:MmyB-like transcription regulator ligand binding domain